jgi:4a-hydroxytetrahydrobiopterin dehydratase
MTSLLDQKCKPCEGGVDPLKPDEFSVYLDSVKEWQVIEQNKKIQKEFTFKNFKQVLDVVNKIGEVAESEGHHPDLNIHDFKKLTVTLWTHAIGGLSINDFIVAAKIDRLTSHLQN